MNTSASQNSISRTTQIKECENQAKFVQQRVTDIETFFGDLCSELVSYTRRTAKLRNNGDEIARILLDYSVKEKIARSTAHVLKRVSEYFATLEDYRHTEINLKNENAARKRELVSRKKLERSNTPEQSKLAELQLHNSIIDANKSADKLERCVVEFEARRLKGLKTVLKDFVHIEMLWHAKALETLSESFNLLQSMHEESDLLDFRTTLMRSSSSQFSMDNPLPAGHSHRQVAGIQSTTEPRRSLDSGQHSTRSSMQAARHSSGDRSGQRGSIHAGSSRSVHAEEVYSLYSDAEGDTDQGHTNMQQLTRPSLTKRELEVKDLEDDDEEEEDGEDDETQDDDEESATGLEDDDEDEDDSEMTRTIPMATGATSSRASSQHTLGSGSRLNVVPPQSPLKSALKSHSSKQAVLG